MFPVEHFFMSTPLPTFEYELNLKDKGFTLIAGIDEVGRGPVAGPIVAAAVIFSSDYNSEIPDGYVKDSKMVAEKKRMKSYDYIRAEAIAIGVGVVSSEYVDNMGISDANKEAYLRAVKDLDVSPDFLLVDGNMKFESPLPYKTIVKGDSICYSIAAASIIAKVYRDRLMQGLSNSYPQYGFDRNKGYGTAEHMKALQKFGLTKHHRASFLTRLSSLGVSKV